MDCPKCTRDGKNVGMHTCDVRSYALNTTKRRRECGMCGTRRTTIEIALPENYTGKHNEDLVLRLHDTIHGQSPGHRTAQMLRTLADQLEGKDDA